jgi:hypothetical protein
MPIRSSNVADCSALDSRVSWRWKSQMAAFAMRTSSLPNCDRCIVCGMQAFGVVDVGGHGEPAVAIGLRLDGLGELCRVMANDHHDWALGDVPLSGRTPEAGAAPGDQGDVALKPAAHGKNSVTRRSSSTAGFLLPKRTFCLALTDPGRFSAKLSVSANRGPKAGRSGSAYSSSKAFVIWYSRQMAARFGAKGARILSVSPGSFDTVMGRRENKSGSEGLVVYAALKRFGTPEEIAELLAFCASSKPGCLTGVDILCRRHLAGLTLKGMLALARGRDRVELITRAAQPEAVAERARSERGATLEAGGAAP